MGVHAPSSGLISTSTPSISAGIVDHERADVTADVEQDRALPGERVLGLAAAASAVWHS